MINISGYSDDIIEVAIRNDDGELTEEEYDSYDKDTLFEFDDGTRLRMTYRGTWMAILEERGTAQVRIEPLVKNDDYYSDLFVIDTKGIQSIRKEKPKE